MTQKANMFKGQKKKKNIPPNRHGKTPQTRKGKRAVKPSKTTHEMDTDKYCTICTRIFERGGMWTPLLKSLLPLTNPYCIGAVTAGDDNPREEVSKFINSCNEMKAATVACKEGGQLSIIKPAQDSSGGSKK